MAQRLAAFLFLCFIALAPTDAQVTGKRFGTLIVHPLYHHEVVGELYAVNANTITISGFTYDGTAPDAYVWGGDSGSTPTSSGFSIGSQLSRAYNNELLANLALPAGKTVADLTVVAVWCKRYNVNFNHVTLAEIPLGQMSGSNGLSASSVIIINANQVQLVDFTYDGSCSGARFWAGTGSAPSSSGHALPDENGSTAALGAYTGQTITLTLPGDETVFDIASGYIGVWCGGADVGHVDTPAENTINVPVGPL